MSTPYDDAIAALEEEISSLTAALQVLRRRSQDQKSPRDARVSFNPDFTSVKANPTNEEAVRAVLEAAHPRYLGVSKIIELGPMVGGRKLNKNSTRWVLKHGIDAGTFEKTKNNGRV